MSLQSSVPKRKKKTDRALHPGLSRSMHKPDRISGKAAKLSYATTKRRPFFVVLNPREIQFVSLSFFYSKKEQDHQIMWRMQKSKNT